ncbi:hypothetical protein GA0115255_106492 [Streptomyces sp. Ncost-T6T-2b]|nr:hypothetical protein GA0115255_106492 [Streptomyces sp. Ncost-T6T-2b]
MTDTGSISDGFHSFDELYEFRLLYHAHAVRAWQAARYPSSAHGACVSGRVSSCLRG